MLNLAAITRAIDVMEEHLREPITLAEVADSIGYSLYHFCRTFARATHHTPYDYLMRRRLSEAARALLQTDQLIGAIAADYQFTAPETFTRAFRRAFGVQPQQWRRQGDADPHRLMPRLSLAHLAHLSKGRYLQPTLVESPEVLIVGLMTLARDEPDLCCELRERMRAELGHDECDDLISVTSYPPGWARRGAWYLVGRARSEPRPPAPPLALTALPGGAYAQFVHKGCEQDLSLTLDYILHTWLPQSEQRWTPALVVRRYGRGWADAPEAESLIAIPVRP